MYSLNAPVPSTVARLAGDVAADLSRARTRERGAHTLVVKRLGDGDHETVARLQARAREALAGEPACEARVTSVEVFETVPAGAAPVVYLRVESPGLVALHDRLCEQFTPVDGIEGAEYVPHVTVARGGSLEAARRAADREVETVEWAVDELLFWDAERDSRTGSVSLPA